MLNIQRPSLPRWVGCKEGGVGVFLPPGWPWEEAMGFSKFKLRNDAFGAFWTTEVHILYTSESILQYTGLMHFWRNMVGVQKPYAKSALCVSVAVRATSYLFHCVQRVLLVES